MTEMIELLLALVLSLSVHEFAHAYTAFYFGDPTSKVMGRLTLNPLAHLDPLGTLMLFVAGFGWGKPVPVNPHNLRNPRWHGLLVAFSGPFSNFILALVFGSLYKFFITVEIPALASFSFAMVNINIILMLFNLIPIPPLDGSKILLALFPSNQSDIRNYLKYGPFLLLFIFIFAPQTIWRFLQPAVLFLRQIVFWQS